MRVNVKWGKELFKDVEVDMEQPPQLFKMQLMSLTNVPVERQKVMGKGGMLKDDSWGKVVFKEGMTVIMMGTAEQLPDVSTAEGVQFVEDLPEDEQDVADTKSYGAGLVNLGNTCYMNSCLQCLYAVPELVPALENSAPGAPQAAFATQAANLFKSMARGVTITPGAFLMTLRSVAPQFNQLGGPSKDPSHLGQRVHAQQDAEECWSAMMVAWSAATKQGGRDPIRDLFGIEYTTSLKCEESGETISETVGALNVKCNVSQDVSHLTSGIKLALVEDREKHSEALGRNALFTGSSRISTLPPYLTIQVMRFFYKAATEGGGGSRAKIMRQVAFTQQLDMFEFCTEELQAELKAPRMAFRAAEDKKQGVTRGAAAAAAGGSATDGDGDEVMSDADAAKDFTGRMTGKFELIAVLTHKGRTLDSGHYIGWVKQKQADTWVQFDDDKLIMRQDEEILRLGDGGDWHTAYLMLFRAQRVPPPDDGAAAAPSAPAAS